MSLQSELIRIARTQVGAHEDGGNNVGPQVKLFQNATWLEPGPWPWCAAYVAWCLREALQTDSGRAFLDDRPIDLWRCRDARAFGWITWAKERRLEVFDESRLAKAGDIVIYDFSHIGIVLGDQIYTSITVAEGNTNLVGARDSQMGDGVWIKVRRVNLVRNYIRFGAAAP